MSEEKVKSRSWVYGSKGVAIVGVLVAGFLVMKYLEKNGPVADRVAPPRVVGVVRVIEAMSGTVPLFVDTHGKVEPRRRTQAASEVMGRIVRVDPRFKAGGVFDQDEIMLAIDRSDYVSMLAAAESSLADAALVLAQEEARADQARRDWLKHGRGEPSGLVVRKPQIVSAKARVVAAEAAVEKAARDLARTELRAPYDCRVEATYADLGSYVMPAARLADLYSNDAFEVRVPVTLEEMGYLKRGDVTGTEVALRARFGGQERAWKGLILRSVGLVDRKTMTMYLVVEIKPNAGGGAYRLPLPGLFVSASITGRVMHDVTQLPRSALRSDNTLLTLTADNKLNIIPVKVARTLNKHVLIAEGLDDGVKVITSPVETPVAGMELRQEGEAE
ncbi:MAG: efflux RND transporter periplasmic adaptor subunit [Verrucomicrobiae bacterium]|nr:efflux RND transporter periplasmic adaptor subunit [Verrucomicrobiae bacterium]NNJ43825.1 efflux RND transporter periplasmic adaptor subunit [Akkermansiaceae bacterium]